MKFWTLQQQDFLPAGCRRCRSNKGWNTVCSNTAVLKCELTAHHWSLFSSHGGAAQLLCGQLRRFVEPESAQSSDAGRATPSISLHAIDRRTSKKSPTLSCHRRPAGYCVPAVLRPAVTDRAIRFPFPGERPDRLLIGSPSGKTASL